MVSCIFEQLGKRIMHLYTGLVILKHEGYRKLVTGRFTYEVNGTLAHWNSRLNFSNINCPFFHFSPVILYFMGS